MTKQPKQMTDAELIRYTEATTNTGKMVLESKEREHDLAVSTAKNILANLEKIELKQRCIRVRLLDWLSDKLLSWSKSVHQMSVKIDSPCVIKLPEPERKLTLTERNYSRLIANSKITGVNPSK